MQPPFQRAVARHAAAAICARLATGADLAQATRAALDERDQQRQARAAATDPAVRERCAMSVARLEMEAICAFHALALARDPRSSSDRAAGRAVDNLAVRMASDESWRLVQAAFDGVSPTLTSERPVAYPLLDRANTLGADPNAPVWSQVAALRFIAVALGPGATPALRRRLRPHGQPDDLFVRAEAATLLASVDPTTAATVLPGCAGDPSEHVRMRLCQLWGLLRQVAPLHTRLRPDIEASPRVRAVATAQLGRADVAALINVLDADPDELPRRMALQQAEGLAGESPPLRAAIADLAHTGPSGTLRRLAAETLERLHHRADQQAALALAQVEEAAAAAAPGQSRVLQSALPPEILGRALAVVSAGDHGLSLQRQRDGHWRLFRGDHRARRLWRVLHELRAPSGEKRQGHRHTTGRRVHGHLRADSGILAEVSPTPVPGERVLVPALGDWGRHLPTVDDLLTRPADGHALIFSSHGVTHIQFPPRTAWTATVLRLHRDYAALAHLRQRALTSVEARERHAFVAALVQRGFRVTFAPHRPTGQPLELLDLFRGTTVTKGPASVTSPASTGLMVVPFWDGLTQALELPRPATHLLAVGLTAFGLMLARLHQARQALRQDRASIPLSIGGWGTRGKSGTERLKAALFQGLGCRVLAKTTGCEAVVLHAIPDVPAEEIYLYRPYDKATIWEQQEIVHLGARLGVDVLLWECMALNPTYVEIVQGSWMRDDLCTVTNAYPDHENIQGPAGADVAQAISQFIPHGRTAFTAEEQMLPILRATAAARGTRLVALDWRDDALLPADLLARFPYQEHPRNIALVVKLAESLGVPAEVALKEMADRVVPDLGVLKTYPQARWRGRTLQFSNGMSANERTGFLSNWSRLGFDSAEDAPGTWIVTVVNNRADRVSRSAAFAEILVQDIAVHRHVLIGTNLGGLNKFIGDALATFTADITLFDATETALPAAERVARATTRARRVLARLRLHDLGGKRLRREALAMARGLGARDVPALGGATFDAALADSAGTLAEATATARARLAAPLGPFCAALGAAGDEALQHLSALTAAHAVLLAWFTALDQAAALDDAAARASRWAALEQSFRLRYAELFRATLVFLDDPGLTGDQVIDRLARAVPPGFQARVMGAQNIKGTGLDFAYRWLIHEQTTETVRALAQASPAGAEALAATLVARAEAGQLGVLDLTAAADAIDAARSRGLAGNALAAAHEKLTARLAGALAQLERTTARAPSLWRRLLGPLLDVFDGVRRRRQADRTLAALGRGQVSQVTAAQTMRALLARQKNGWLAGSDRS